MSVDLGAAQDFIRSQLRVKRIEGFEHNCICPFCEGDSFRINAQTGFWLCWKVCPGGEGGKIESLAMRLLRIPWSEASEMFGRTIAYTRGEAIEAMQWQPRDNPAVDHVLPKGLKLATGNRYLLHDRKMSELSIARNCLLEAPRGHEYDQRIIVPILCDGNRTFLARSTRADIPKGLRYRTPDDARLSTMLYGYDDLTPGLDIVVVEGSFDRMRIHASGIPTVACLKKSLSSRQIVLLQRAKPRRVILWFDEGCEADAEKSASRVVRASMCAYIVRGQRDPDDVGLEPQSAREAVQGATKHEDIAKSSVMRSMEKFSKWI